MYHQDTIPDTIHNMLTASSEKKIKIRLPFLLSLSYWRNPTTLLPTIIVFISSDIIKSFVDLTLHLAFGKLTYFLRIPSIVLLAHFIKFKMFRILIF
jgi:hypothetical protein